MFICESNSFVHFIWGDKTERKIQVMAITYTCKQLIALIGKMANIIQNFYIHLFKLILASILIPCQPTIQVPLYKCLAINVAAEADK